MRKAVVVKFAFTRKSKHTRPKRLTIYKKTRRNLSPSVPENPPEPRRAFKAVNDNAERSARIIHGDNLPIMARMAPGTVDLIVTSPPYLNVGMEYGDAFDSVAAYVEFSRTWIKAAAATLKPTGGMWINVGHARTSAKDPTRVPLTYHLFPVLADCGLTMVQEVVWDRRVTQYTKHRFATQTERWMYVVKDVTSFTFESDRVRDPSLNRTHHDPRDRPEGKAPSDLWNFSQVTHNSRERTAHPCQFPVAMIERIVLTCSNVGETVMDPFAGSGTTGVAALKHGRKAVLIEREAKYCDIIEARTEGVKLDEVETGLLDLLRQAPDEMWLRLAA